MSDLLVDFSHLPEDIREKLAELDLELSEGEFFFYEFAIGGPCGWLKMHSTHNKQGKSAAVYWVPESSGASFTVCFVCWQTDQYFSFIFSVLRCAVLVQASLLTAGFVVHVWSVLYDDDDVAQCLRASANKEINQTTCLHNFKAEIW